MVGVLVLVLGASPFVAVDGGYLAQSRLSVPHRTIEVFAPESAMAPIVVSDGDAPLTQLSLNIEAGPAPQLDGGQLFYGDALLAIAEPLTLRIKRPGSLTLQVNQPISRRDGERYFVDREAASFALIPSVPFEELGAGRLRVTDATATVDVQLQVSGPPVGWPVLGGYQSWGASLAWDAARGRITRFGGGDAFELEPGTYVWDPLAGWQLLPIASPPPRVRASLVYDSVRQRLVLFGGLGATGLLADTWEFDGTTWTEVTPTESPPRRWSHGAAFDEDTGTMLLFGGLEGLDPSNLELGDTWQWDGFTWTELHPANSPSSRDAFGMTWDGTRRRITLVAGWDGMNNLNDAWAWVGGNWQALPPLPATPRSSTALAWSPLTGELILAGGWDPRGGPQYFLETWRFDGTTWTQGLALPSPRARVALVGHPTMGVLMLGGRLGEKSFSAELGMLEPQWQRLTQGEGPERGPVFGGDGIIGQRYVWIRAAGEWLAVFRIGPTTQILGASRSAEATIYYVEDGGLRAFDTSSQLLGLPPPPFEHLSQNDGTVWLIDELGGLRESSRGWTLLGTVPPGVRALTPRSPLEYFVWRGEGLSVWNLADGGLMPFGPPLALDGGVVITPSTVQTAIASGEAGSWHLSQSGTWVYVGQPLAPELVDRAIVTDAGLASWSYLKPSGARCERANECLSHFCAQGRCCDQACDRTCEVCTRAAGAAIDGRCQVASSSTVCLENECGEKAFCNGVSPVCLSTPPVCVDAGMEPEPEPEPARDAGSKPRDAGPPIVEEPPDPPAGCGCAGASDLVWLLAAAWLVRRRHFAAAVVGSVAGTR